MSHKTLFNDSFFTLLIKIDQDFLEKIQKKGCHCGGKLHQNHYPRSPMGLPQEYRHYFEIRFSLCCALCRKRTTTPTMRFFGRRWYPSFLFLFISLLQKGASERRLLFIKKRFLFSVSKSTWKRWRRWWQDCFITTTFWKQERGKFNATSLSGYYPKNLFKVFRGSFEERMILLVQFFAPITAGFVCAV